MVHTTSCQRCGTTTDVESLEGLCGRCLATVAFAPEPEGHDSELKAQILAGFNQTIALDTPALEAAGAAITRFGDYELIHEIARGGMGVVYKARQISLNRIVAVKMILNARFNNPQFVRRFRAEAEAAANLRHPNIVGIYEIGEHDGQHYFSMEYVEGHDLQFFVNESLPPQRTAQHVRTIAEAIHHAHQHGILHRDLKPSNVLVDLNGEVRITDFGLAKRVPGTRAGSVGSRLGSTILGGASELDATASGQILGSPGYMSPEQADGRSRDVDVRSDVYAVGAILYALLTGRPPFIADTIEGALRQILQAEPVSLRLLNPRVPKDLETICLKCLQKEPDRRYNSAQDVADELGRFLRNEPIRALPISKAATLWRWCRRNRKLASVTALAVLGLLVISIGSPFVAYRLNAARILAEKRELAARHNAYAADMSVVYDAIRRPNFAHALRILGLHRPSGHQTDLRGWEWRYFWQQCQSDELATLARHTATISAVSISPDGQWLAARDVKGIVKIVRITDGSQKLSIDAGKGPAPAFSPDGRFMAIVDTQKKIRFFDLTTSAELTGSLEHDRSVIALAFSPNGQQLITFSGGILRIWQWAAGLEMTRYDVPLTNSTTEAHAKILPNARGVILSDDNRHARIWTIDAGTTFTFDSEHIKTGGKPIDFCVSSDGALIATASALTSGGGYTIQIWETATGRHVFFPAHQGFITSIIFSPDGRHLASTSEDQTTCLWDTRTGRLSAVLKGHNAIVTAATFVPNERKVVTGGADGTVKISDTAPRVASNRTLPLDKLVTAEMIGEYRGSISPDRSRMAMILKDGTGTLINLHEVKVAKEFAVPFTNITRVAINTGGEIIACARPEGVLSLLDMGSLKPLANFPLIRPEVMGALIFSRDGKWLAGRTASGAFQLWEITGSREVQEWRNRIRNATGLCFSPDSRVLACGSFDNAITLWDIETGMPIARLRGPRQGILQLAFSNDGRRIGCTGRDGTARVWDIATQAQIATFAGARENFFRISFSPDGTRLLVNDWDDTVVFDIAAERQLLRIKSTMPYFIDDDTLLGLSSDELWLYRPPTLATIDASESR